MGRFTKIPLSTFDELQMDAGVLLNTFDPANPAITDEAIITATTGGFTINVTPTFSDLGSDVDNCPENTKELKHLDGWNVSIAFTALGTAAAKLKLALGCADVTGNKVVPRASLEQSDFSDKWWVGDTSNGGAVAVKLINALSTAGLSIKTTKNGKGQLSVTLTGHVSIEHQDVVPIEFYLLDAEDSVSIYLDKSSASVAVGSTVAITATKNPADATVTWSSSDEDVATVSNGTVTGVSAGLAVIVAKASYDGAEAVASCTVEVTGGEG